MNALKMSDLMEGITSISEKEDCWVTGLCSDSREISEGNCFFALKGLHEDGRNFIPHAVQKGASAIILDESTPYSSEISIPLITLPCLAKKLGEIAARFYSRPSERLTLIGITGTNGKTSTSQYIAMAMHMDLKPCGVIGTLGYGFPGSLHPTTQTTSDPLVLQKQLADIYQKGACAIAMEVSSHALDQHRTESIAFDIAIFTNLTRDHLNYHGSMENYAAAKRKLFYAKGLNYAIINTDDSFGLKLAEELGDKLQIYRYGMQINDPLPPSVVAQDVRLNAEGMTAEISSPWGRGQLRSKLLGRFNISNLLAVLITLQLVGIPFERGLDYISHLQTLPGRMQVLGGGRLPLVIVDYAHSPDALMQVLLALREHTSSTLWCIFGCGGDRDRGKRPLMGQIAERYADQLVITDDNPRTEDPSQIIAEIMRGLLCPWAVEIEHDRSAAIAHVISCAQAGDVILVAGKGHEDYQIIGTEKFPFSDSLHVQTQLLLKQQQFLVE
jgi:UDP-N-acetylmuramoyl-L-alanyl-D-glutamate--2,6-diaminopimelate ligase